MTELLWMPAWTDPNAPNPNYVKSFDARVQKILDDWVVLDRSAFYSEGGGQPADQGTLSWDGGEAKVKHVSRKGIMKHVLEGGLPPAGAVVHGEIDWRLRFDHMRYHTSQHLLSGVLWELKRAGTAGNQIRDDHARVDFEVDSLTPEDLGEIEARANALVKDDLPIRIFDADRDAFEATLGERPVLKLVPQSVRRLRVVQIGEGDAMADVCPCAGTHVGSTRELGNLEIVSKESKGAGKMRLEYVLK